MNEIPTPSDRNHPFGDWPQDTKVGIDQCVMLKPVGSWHDYLVFSIQPIAQSIVVDHLKGISMGNPFSLNR